MKTKRKWNNQRQKMKKRENITEREDILKALEEQRKRQEIVMESDTNQKKQPKSIPGFYYDEVKGKYFPLDMKKKKNENYDTIQSIKYTPFPIVFQQQKIIPHHSIIPTNLFHSSIHTIYSTESSIKGITILNNILGIATYNQFLLFPFSITNQRIQLALVPQRLSIENEISFLTHDSSEFLLVLNSSSSSSLFHIQQNGRCFLEKLPFYCLCVIPYGNERVYYGKSIYMKRQDKYEFIHSLPSDGICGCMNKEGVLIGCQGGEIVWFDKDKNKSKVIGKMKRRIKECKCWNNSFVVCDWNGDCWILHTVSYSKQYFSILHLVKKIVVCVCCNENGILVGTQQGSLWFDWDGYCLDKWNQERSIQWIEYSSPIVCTISQSNIQIQVEKGYSFQQIVLYECLLTNRQINFFIMINRILRCFKILIN